MRAGRSKKKGRSSVARGAALVHAGVVRHGSRVTSSPPRFALLFTAQFAAVGVMLPFIPPLMAGRGHVLPGDLQSVLPQVLAHRLEPAPGSALGARAQVLALLQAVPV